MEKTVEKQSETVGILWKNLETTWKTWKNPTTKSQLPLAIPSFFLPQTLPNVQRPNAERRRWLGLNALDIWPPKRSRSRRTARRRRRTLWVGFHGRRGKWPKRRNLESSLCYVVVITWITYKWPWQIGRIAIHHAFGAKSWFTILDDIFVSAGPRRQRRAHWRCHLRPPMVAESMVATLPHWGFEVVEKVSRYPSLSIHPPKKNQAINVDVVRLRLRVWCFFWAERVAYNLWKAKNYVVENRGPQGHLSF